MIKTRMHTVAPRDINIAVGCLAHPGARDGDKNDVDNEDDGCEHGRNEPDGKSEEGRDACGAHARVECEEKREECKGTGWWCEWGM